MLINLKDNARMDDLVYFDVQNDTSLDVELRYAKGAKNFVEKAKAGETDKNILPEEGEYDILATATVGSAYVDKSAYANIQEGTKLTLSRGGPVRKDASSLQSGRTSLAATNVGDYALFGGGCYRTSSSSDVERAYVDAYDTSLTQTTPESLSVARDELAAASTPTHALFAGGNYGSKNTVDAYDTSLTRSIPTVLSRDRAALAGCSFGEYAIFAGGYSQNGASDYNIIDIYDSSLTRRNDITLTRTLSCLSGAVAGDHAIFTLGRYYSSGTVASNVANAIDKSLTCESITAVSTARYCGAGTSVGKYALFGGGNSSSTTTSYATVDAYDPSLVRMTISPLSGTRFSNAAATTGTDDYALFAGGFSYENNTFGSYATVDVYNQSLTKTVGPGLSRSMGRMAGTKVGLYALFGGGDYWNNGYYSHANVSAYAVSINLTAA